MILGRPGLLVAMGLFLFCRSIAASTQVNSGDGSEAFSLLDQPAGARGLAMGSAFDAVADDFSGQLWNPAAPGLAQGIEAGENHETWLAGTSRDVASLQAPLLPWLAAGAFGALVEYPAMAERDASGAYLGSSSPMDQGYGLSLAAHFAGLGLGFSGRYLNQQLLGYTSSQLAGGMGLLWDPWESLRIGLDVFEAPQYDGSVKPRGSAAWSLRGVVDGWRWTGAGVFRVDPGAQSETDLGLEMGTGKDVPVAFRAGFTQLFPGTGSSTDQRWSFGFGLGYEQLQLDYAYLPWGDFGATHRVSLSWHLAGRPAPMPPTTSAPAPTPTPTPLMPVLPTATVPAPATPTAETRLHVLSDLDAQGRSLQAAGRNLDAMQAYLGGVKADPADVEAWRGLARVYAALGRTDYAHSCWQRVLALDPGDPEATSALAAP